MSHDRRAVYDPRTETVVTGHGEHVRLRDLHRALSTLSALGLRRLVTRSGLTRAVTDPCEAGEAETIRDILDLFRGMPQYCRPLIESALEIPNMKPAFSALLRNRRFGSSNRTSSAVYSRPPDPKHNDKISAFFYESRAEPGEFGYFVRHDRKCTTLRSGQRFSSTKPYEECFLIMRTTFGRFFLRWPTAQPHVPAFYLDKDGNATDFFPSEEDFEEVFPGYTYEVFGVQFALPNIGTDYRAWFEDTAETGAAEPESEPTSTGTPDRRRELLELLEAVHLEITTMDELSRHFRRLSVKYHPLKHLHADADEKERINRRYLDITNAYNELKRHFAS